MEFKDVVKHYIGSYCLRPDNKTLLQIYGVLGLRDGQLIQHEEDGQITYSSAHGCKPILLPLSAMTEEQALEAIKLVWHWPSIEYHGFKKHVAESDNSIGFTCLNEFGGKVGLTIDCHRSPEFSINGASLMIPIFKLTAWLYRNHFDLHNLIENGQAIDATTLTVNPYK